MFSKKDLIYAIYKEKSFSKAAESLYISQPSLSAMVKKIESKIGEPIFDRSTNPIQLTEIGEKYIECCKDVSNTEDAFMNYLNDTHELKTGSLSIGGNHLFMANILPGPLEEFAQRYPGIKLHLVESHSSDLENKLLGGDLDLIIDNRELSPDVCDKFSLGTEFLLLAVPKKMKINELLIKYRLTGKDIKNNRHLDSGSVSSAPLQKFSDIPFILMDTGNDTRTRTDNVFRRHRIKPNVIFELNQLATVYSMIYSGLGASFISDTLIKQSPDSIDRLFLYKIDDPDTKRDVFFHSKKNRYMTKAAKEFLNLSREHSILTIPS